MGDFRDFKNSFPEDSHSKGKAFERFLADWFFKNHPLYRHKFEKVWLWEDWPKPKGVTAQDLGTDLIARDTEGKIYAIQAKFYDVDSHIKFKDISTFLADSSKDYIDHRLLIGTAELAPNARKQLNSQEKPVSTFLLHDFEAWDFAWPKSLASLAKAKIKKPHEARPHQRAAIKDVCAKLDGRGQLIMACGTGKTLTGQRIAEKLESETTLVLLPSLLLLSGTMNEWLQQTKVGFHYLPVCSDASIGGKAAPETNFTSGELGNASTTDPKEIRKFLRRKGNKVIFSTYQSSGRVADALKGTRIKFDLILADEAHRCAGKVAADYGFVLDAKKLPAKNRLFMTATPRIYKSNIKKAAKDADIQIASMDDETVFGPVVHHLTFGKAIEGKLLTDYQVVVVGVNDTAVGEMVDERALVKTEAGLERDAQTLGSQLGLMKAVKKYDLQRVITFHSRINQARDYAAEFLEVMDATKKKDKPSGTITYSHVSGAMPTSERNNKLRALGLLEYEDRYLLGNARCLSEGVDVPALDGVAFVDPRRSEIDIIQAVGRAIRKSSSKTKGTIIIPVFIEGDDDPDLVLSTSAFDQVWKVVNALRAHDEKLGEELDQIRRAEGRGERLSIEDTKLIFDVHESVGESFLQAFETKLVEATTESWEFWFGLLQVYRNEHGDCLVPNRFASKNGLRLGNWVGNQRTHVSKLSKEKIDRLDSIGFVWDPYEQQWEEAFAALERYCAEHGDCLVPKGYVSHSGPKLDSWVQNQRTAVGTLSKEKIDRLNSIGFIWNVREHQWEEAAAALEQYCAEHGDCFVPHNYTTVSGLKLGRWVGTQRLTVETLSKDKIDRLNSIGFIWDVPGYQWDKGFAALEQYYAEHGDLLVPHKYVTASGFKLGLWVANQRSADETLSKERLDRLNSFGFVWDALEQQWENGFAALEQYYLEHGDCLVPPAYVSQSGLTLGSWVRTQRATAVTLSKERLDRLNRIGFIWDTNTHKWDEDFSELEQYCAEHGNCLVPGGYVSQSGLTLGEWVSTQRKAFAKLSKDKIDRLNSIGFIWDVPGYQWDKGFEALKHYYAEHGDCLVPRRYVSQSGRKLGNWVLDQRKHVSRLSKDKVDRLNGIGFVWDQYQHQWEEGFAALKQYRAEHGNYLVPHDYVTASGTKLGAWVRNQRHSAVKLNKDRVDRLDGVGFVWSVKEQQWEEGFAALEQYYAEHGDCLVQKSYVAQSGLKLGEWVSTQRRARTTLSKERLDRLNSIAFVWDANERKQHKWEQFFAALEQYYAEHGNCLVQTDHVTQSGIALGKWVSRQRAGATKLSKDRIDRLNSIGFIWDVSDHQWEEGLAALEKYYAEHGNCLVPSGYISQSGFRLGAWVSNKRNNGKNLSKERLDRLNNIGFVWERNKQKRQQWEDGFAALEQYYAEQGDCLVPAGYVSPSGLKLGSWVSTQRKAATTLSKDKVDRLNNIGFVWWGRYEQKWENGFAALEQYFAEYGDCLVPRKYVAQSGLKLGVWVRSQRKALKTLSKERLDRLNSIGFIWNAK